MELTCRQQNNSGKSWALLGVALLFPQISAAVDLPASSQPPQQATPASPQPVPDVAELLPPGMVESIDTSRNYVSDKILTFAKDVDRFFGGDRNFQETNQSVIQLDFTRLMQPAANNKNALTGRVKLHLPSTEQRLHLMIESDPDKKVAVPEGQGAPTASTATSPGSYAASLRYEKSREETRVWYFSADAGARFQGIRLNPFVRSRASISVPMEEWRMKLAETVFWFNNIGVGETTQMDWERFWSKDILFRSTSGLTWLHDKQGFDANQSLTVFHTLDERRAMMYQASVVGGSQPQWQVADYAILMSYRHRLHKEWMFAEVSPQMHFPKTQNFRFSPLLILRLEMLFDGSK